MISYKKLSFTKQLQQLIESHDIITIFRHVSPDGDAYGSSFGLRDYLRFQYPNKQVYLLSDDDADLVGFYPPKDEISQELVAQSLALVLDTANRPRISGSLWESAKLSVKIDHHPAVDCYADYNFVDDKASSTCEIVGLYILETNPTVNLPYSVARLLFSGLLTDTVNLSVSAVNSNTYIIAGFLMQFGIDVGEINDQLFIETKNVYDCKTWLRSHYKYEAGVVYCFIQESDIKPFNLSLSSVKNQVNVYKTLADAQIWLILALDDETKTYDISIRSRKVVINDIATKYGGGGHSLASGIKGVSQADSYKLIEDLKNKLK